jgi:SAM-dependent methyltransferase
MEAMTSRGHAQMTDTGTGRLRLKVKSILPPRLVVLARCVLRDLPMPRWGNMRRISPFSTAYGFERGTPVDRYYLDRFLDANRALIMGRVLEVQVPSYTKRFGEDVTESHTVDINPRFQTTYTCDLADGTPIPSDYYDCLLAPNTLQHLLDLRAALRTMLRVVKPGGTLLASAAMLLPLIPEGGDYWRLTPEGWRVVLEEEWPQCEIAVQGNGNCLSAAAAMYGLTLEELKPAELEAYDPRYPVLITIRCRKPVDTRVQTA